MTVTGTVFTGQNLSQAESDFASASSQFAALSPTQTFALLNADTTITGNGGDNIIQAGFIQLQNKNLTLSGGPNDYFIFNVTNDLLMSSTLMTLLGGVTPNHVLFNVLGNGLSNGGISVNLLNAGSTLFGTFLAPNGNIDVGQAQVTGALLGGVGTTSSNAGITIHSDADIFNIFNNNGINSFTNFEPQQVISAVPEPSSATLLGIGSLVIVAALRRRRAGALQRSVV
jgi:PEP-CTERM motif